jgi:hypothetical protein
MSHNEEPKKEINRTVANDKNNKIIDIKKIQEIIQADLNTRKAQGYDLIAGKLLQEMPRKRIVHVTSICNSVIRTGYFPVQWKVAQIIMIPKPGKPPKEFISCRPISLLPIMRKIFEKTELKRLRPILQENRIPPDFDRNTVP